MSSNDALEDAPEGTPEDTRINLPKGQINFLAFVTYWILKSKIVIWIRSELSLALAITLAILGIGREILEIAKLPDAIKQSQLIWLWGLFLFITSVLALIAAIWELKGNKLATTPQERRFIAGMHKLMVAFDDFRQTLDDVENEEDAEKELLIFEKILLKTSSWTLCGVYPVYSALMIYDEKRQGLTLDKSKHFHVEESSDVNDMIHIISESDDTPVELFINLGETSKDKIGPAAIAFEKKDSIIHLPKKSNKIGFIHSRDKKGKFTIIGNFIGWYPSEHKDFEDFRSVLSVAITISTKDESTLPLGVINFTTRDRDLFTPRDYTMALCFASFAAQARHATMLKIKALKKAEATLISEEK